MDILVWLIPISLLLGALGLGAFMWTVYARQYDDPAGDAERILLPDWDDHPKTQAVTLPKSPSGRRGS